MHMWRNVSIMTVFLKTKKQTFTTCKGSGIQGVGLHEQASAHTYNVRDMLKKSMPCLIKKVSRCAAHHTSKTTSSFTFYITPRSYEKTMCIYLLFDWFSGENCIIFTFSLHKG